MNRKILPLNMHPSITSFVHHSYPNAIIEASLLVKLYVQEETNHTWTCDSPQDVTYKMNSEEHSFEVHGTNSRKSTGIVLSRPCELHDELIVSLQEWKLVDRFTFINIVIDSNALLGNEVAHPDTRNQLCMSWDQYYFNINGVKEHIYNHEKAYYKLERTNKMITASLSFDQVNWNVIQSFDFEGVTEAPMYFHLNVYYGEDRYNIWKYMNYLQLYYNENDYNGVYLDYFMFPQKISDASYNYFCNYIDTSYINIVDYINVFPDMVAFIKWQIDCNAYPNVSLDEFYIPDRDAYQKKEYYHYNLFYGYDDYEQVFYIFGYNKLGKVQANKISYDLLRNDHKCIYTMDVVSYKLKVNFQAIQFQINYIKQMIQEFLTGEDTSKHYANLLYQFEGSYGIRIFDSLTQTEAGRTLICTNRRISFLLYEHSILAKERLEYLIEHNYVAPSSIEELAILCGKMVHQCENLKLLVVKNLKSNKEESKIVESMNQLRETEVEFYTILLHSLLDFKQEQPR